MSETVIHKHEKSQYDNSRSSFSYASFFGGPKILLIVPHPDDEVNTAGATVVGAVQEGMEVHIAYMTNGDWEYDIPLRNIEAIKACEVLGVSQNHVHFLNYPDCGDHTYSVYTHQDTLFMYGDREISWNTLVQDVINLIEAIDPDAVICTGWDSHIDHRQCESSVLTAMKQIWATGSTTRLYTAFAYTTAYESVDDWYHRHFQSTVMNLDINNDAVRWEERLRVPVPELCRETSLTDHILYRALACHISQAAYRRSTKIINSDQTFWFCGPFEIPFNTPLNEATKIGRDEVFTYVQIMIDNNFIYDYQLYVGESQPMVSVYAGTSTIGEVLAANDERLQWYCNGHSIDDGMFETIEWYMAAFRLEKVWIRCEWKDNPAIYHEALIKGGTYLEWITYGCGRIKSAIRYRIDHQRRRKVYKSIRSHMRPFSL